MMHNVNYTPIVAHNVTYKAPSLHSYSLGKTPPIVLMILWSKVDTVLMVLCSSPKLFTRWVLMGILCSSPKLLASLCSTMPGVSPLMGSST